MQASDIAKLELVLRCLTSPGKKRVVGAWALYKDVSDTISDNKSWEMPSSPSPRPYEIRIVPEKGRGMVATRDIKRGEVILRERPVVMAPKYTVEDARTPYKRMESILLQLVYWLEQEDREKFVNLYNCKSLEECGPLAGIFRTNGVAMFFDSKDVTDYVCVCLDISYCNHSCARNAATRTDRGSFIFTLFADHDIAEGEEITISYIESGILPFVDRQAELEQKYKFTCACSLCSQPIDPSREKKRKFITSEIESLHSRWEAFISLHVMEAMRRKAQEEDKRVRKALRMMDEMGIVKQRIQFLQHMAFMYAILHDVEQFREWGRKCADWPHEPNGGIDMAKEWRGWVANPRSSPFWGMAFC